ncbi:hypothetical protein CL657_00585 [bacterium]|nr:hypothetical protein [bacterium]
MIEFKTGLTNIKNILYSLIKFSEENSKKFNTNMSYKYNEKTSNDSNQQLLPVIATASFEIGLLF